MSSFAPDSMDPRRIIEWQIKGIGGTSGTIEADELFQYLIVRNQRSINFQTIKEVYKTNLSVVCPDKLIFLHKLYLLFLLQVTKIARSLINRYHIKYN